MPSSVLFYVQHLLGIGHVVRSSRIARALDKAGFAVTIAYGGRPVPGIDWGGAELVELPSVAAGPNGFSSLIDETGQAVTEAMKESRRDLLVQLFQDVKPDILLLEAYPFARRIMRFELLPLLHAAHDSRPRPLIVASIRDILQEGRKAERISETRQLVEQFFDGILVHGNQEFAPLQATFPQADRIASKLHYTGWVGPESKVTNASDRFDVIVSAGGGAVGQTLFEVALSVRASADFAVGKWLVLTGPNLSEDAFKKLGGRLPAFVTLERFRPDLPALLKTAQVSISQAGYNTVADVLTAGCRAVLVPFAEGGETEQTRRANILQDQGRAVVVPQAELSVVTLSAALSRAIALSPPDPVGMMGGAENSARILQKLLAQRDEG